MKNVGAHNPIKIPNRSPWAESGDLAMAQTAILARMEANPRTKHAPLSPLMSGLRLLLLSDAFNLDIFFFGER